MANAGTIRQHIIFAAGNQLDTKQALGRISVFDYPMALPQAIIQCRDYRFQPRELPNVPAVKVFDPGFHAAVRAPNLKNGEVRRKFRRLSDITVLRTKSVESSH